MLGLAKEVIWPLCRLDGAGESSEGDPPRRREGRQTGLGGNARLGVRQV